ncbi:glycosyltransferase [Paenibacillus sp. y28]|uniref:glycosyltransferase n=1 Tax=Paenibacillus sp. y28 TaxID=3129110 RepID=UPI003016F449
MKQARVAIVHDYLNQMGGAERVVAVMHGMFAAAPIFTTIADRGKLLPEMQRADIRTTWMQRIPGILRRFKFYFWLYPLAVRSLPLQDYDIILSSSSAYAKAAAGQRAVHVCYCHTPMRFAWEFESYMEGMGVHPMLKRLASWMMSPLRRWDVATSRRVDYFIANSTAVRERIRRCYGRDAAVIYPPVATSRFSVSPEPPGGYYLIVSRLVSYKRLDLAVQACTRLGRRLVVIGDGPDRQRLESLAGPEVQFLGRLPDDQVVGYMQRCRALLFPGLEDFGITPLEVNACGRPVIAFRGGGALDTIQPGVNGLFFDEPSADSVAAAIERCEQSEWDPGVIRAHACRFDQERFTAQLRCFIEEAVEKTAGHPAASAAAPENGSAALL